MWYYTLSSNKSGSKRFHVFITSQKISMQFINMKQSQTTEKYISVLRNQIAVLEVLTSQYDQNVYNMKDNI